MQRSESAHQYSKTTHFQESCGGKINGWIELLDIEGK